MTLTNDNFPESDDYIYFLSVLICCFIVTILLIIQIRKVYSDLCTKERKSVSHRTANPIITKLYTSVNIMTCFSIFCYAITGLLECFKQGHSRKCIIEFYVVVVFLIWSKSSIFTVYLLRILSTYGHSRYAYPKWIIYILIAIQWIIGLSLPIIINIFTKIFVFDEDGFPDPCWGIFRDFEALWLITWDFVMNFGSLIAFTIPLYKTLHDTKRKKSNNTNSNKENVDHTVNRVHSSRKNMKGIGIKVSVLTSVSSITTIGALIAFVAFTFAHIFPFDWVINSVCLMLMTPYYPDEIYFHRLCGICIKCCCIETKTIEINHELDAHSQSTVDNVSGTNDENMIVDIIANASNSSIK
eukprot:296770_1